MDLVLLTRTIVSKLVMDSEAVSVRELETTEENLVHVEIVVAQEDLGRVIGKNGRTIQSIRNVVQAGSNLNEKKRIRIDVDSY